MGNRKIVRLSVSKTKKKRYEVLRKMKGDVTARNEGVGLGQDEPGVADDYENGKTQPSLTKYHIGLLYFTFRLNS